LVESKNTATAMKSQLSKEDASADSITRSTKKK
jgi:hypothetical protein